MQTLVIEYVLDARHPGYNYTSVTNGFDDATLKLIWRSAMPRGQGWSRYIGARSFKAFAVDRQRVAVSEVTVTDQQDESGRSGIRRAEITVLDAADYLDYLHLKLVMFPEAVREDAGRRLGLWRWRRILGQATPKMRRDAQVVLAHPYKNARDWQVVEAVVFMVATARRLQAMKGWGQVNPLTTLALTAQDESRLVALPWDEAQKHEADAVDVT